MHKFCACLTSGRGFGWRMVQRVDQNRETEIHRRETERHIQRDRQKDTKTETERKTDDIEYQ